MEINATLLGQMLTFMVFAWFTMHYIWPMLEAALEARKKQIAEGLAAAEQGAHMLKMAQQEVKQELKLARQKSSEIIAEANKHATLIIEEAKLNAYKEKEEILNAGHTQIQQELSRVKTELRSQVADLVVMGAEKILARHINVTDDHALLNEIAKEL